ncbi:MAG: hypothetical protein R3F14_02460 [Polyangiaceae bacterium]
MAVRASEFDLRSQHIRLASPRVCESADAASLRPARIDTSPRRVVPLDAWRRRGSAPSPSHRSTKLRSPRRLDRHTLLAGIHRSILAAVATAPTPESSSTLDLHELNAASCDEDGADPLRQWLINARALTDGRPEEQVFAEHLASLPEARPRLPPGPSRPAVPAALSAAPVASGAGLPTRWTDSPAQRARSRARSQPMPSKERTRDHHSCPICGYDGFMLRRYRPTWPSPQSSRWASRSPLVALLPIFVIEG